MKEFRISAAGVILHQDRVLLVRYKGQNDDTFLVGPGGGVQIEEDLHAGLKREVLEETGLHVSPGKMLVVEDMLASKYRVIKVWFLCTLAGGSLAKTEAAHIEGIIDVGWYAKDQLANETVYPEILQTFDWAEFSSNNFETKYLNMQKANF